MPPESWWLLGEFQPATFGGRRSPRGPGAGAIPQPRDHLLWLAAEKRRVERITLLEDFVREHVPQGLELGPAQPGSRT